MEFEELGEDGGDHEHLEEISDLQEEVHEVGFLTDKEKIECLEDRSSIIETIEELQKLAATAASETEAAPKRANDEEMEQEALSGQHHSDCLTFAAVHAELKKHSHFSFGHADAKGQDGCLKRGELMAPWLKQFCEKVALHDGMLSNVQVQGTIKQTENQFNIYTHELSKARQYAKLRAGRASRLQTWMASQETLRSKVCPKKTDQESGPLQPLEACRPISSSEAQFVLFKAGDLVTSYALGLVLSVYRGSVSKSKATSRRISLSKPLCSAAPPFAVSKVRLLQLDPISSTNSCVASPLSQQHVVEVEDICGEVKVVEEGYRGSKLFVSFGAETLRVLKELQEGNLVFGKGEAKVGKKHAASSTQEFNGFTMKSFSKGEAGDKNIL